MTETTESVQYTCGESEFFELSVDVDDDTGVLYMPWGSLFLDRQDMQALACIFGQYKARMSAVVTNTKAVTANGAAIQ